MNLTYLSLCYLPKGPVDAVKVRNFAEGRLARLRASQELVNDKYKFIAHLESITDGIIGMNKEKIDQVTSGNNSERDHHLTATTTFPLAQIVFNTDSISLEDYKLPCNDSLSKLKQLRESFNKFNAINTSINNEEKRVSFVYMNDDKVGYDEFRNTNPITELDKISSFKSEESTLDNNFARPNNSDKFAVGGIISTENLPKSNRDESILQPKLTDEIDFSGNWKGSKTANGNNRYSTTPLISGGSRILNKSLDLSGLSSENLKDINANR